MIKKILTPDYVFEVSWEVCNKVGGIYTVLSSRAKTMQQAHIDTTFFIGPDIWKEKENPLFAEEPTLLPEWREAALRRGLEIRVGRWQVPGQPIAVLVTFQPLLARKNEIYAEAWNSFSVDSLKAYGDYDEASMFSYAAGLLAEAVVTD